MVRAGLDKNPMSGVGFVEYTISHLGYQIRTEFVDRFGVIFWAQNVHYLPRVVLGLYQKEWRFD
jgi:hypothetical protein